MKDWIGSLCLACIMTFAAGGIQADVLHMSDGSRLVGTLVQITEGEAVVRDTFAGELTFPRAAIVGIETDEPVTLQLADGAYLTGRLRAAEEGAVDLDVDQLGSRELAMADISGVYRDDPQELQRRLLGIKVSAEANVGITLTSGNTESENLHLDGRVVARSPRNRYTLFGEYNEEESENVQVKQNWTGLVKYDHFVSDQWFWFNSATFESDEFADLELRAALAAGMGYQFFDTAERSLSLEIGPSYIDENFEVAPDDSYLGSRWSLQYDQRIWNGLSFYHFHEGLLGLEDTSDLTIRSRTGLRMTLTERIIARVQTAVDWNDSPPEDTESTQVEHTFTIGYRL